MTIDLNWLNCSGRPNFATQLAVIGLFERLFSKYKPICFNITEEDPGDLLFWVVRSTDEGQNRW